MDIKLNKTQRETEFIPISLKGTTIRVNKKEPNEIFFLHIKKEHGGGPNGEPQYGNQIVLSSNEYLSFKLEYRGEKEIEFEITEG